MMKKSETQRKKHATKTYRQADAQNGEASLTSLGKDIGKSLLITIGTALLLLTVASLVAYFQKDPDSLIRPLALLSSGLTAMIGGFAAVRIHKRSALICGLLNGSALTLLMLLLSLAFRPFASGYSGAVSFLLHTAFLLLSVAGAFLGLQRTPKQKHKH